MLLKKLLPMSQKKIYETEFYELLHDNLCTNSIDTIAQIKDVYNKIKKLHNFSLPRLEDLLKEKKGSSKYQEIKIELIDWLDDFIET
ncbi:hypothetical protein ACFLZV_00710 [Candidatus Margulisiibacteriota bacterium]